VKRVPVMTALAALAALLLLPVLARAADDKAAADKPQAADNATADKATADKSDTDKSDQAGQAAARSQAKPDAEGFYTLFDGKSLDGWKADERPQTFKVEDGNIVVNGERAHLFYMGPVNNHDFKDFHFKAEVMTFPNSNSGIYFHSKPQGGGFPNQGFECQVNNTYKADPKKTGGLYGVKDVMNTAPVGDNEWFTYDIIVKGNHVEIKINGKTTADWTQPADWKTGEFNGRKIGHGTFALQGHDPGSKVMFRNIKVKPL
jgi:3-keto-disaccharide hydrolase